MLHKGEWVAAPLGTNLKIQDRKNIKRSCKGRDTSSFTVKGLMFFCLVKLWVCELKVIIQIHNDLLQDTHANLDLWINCPFSFLRIRVTTLWTFRSISIGKFNPILAKFRNASLWNRTSRFYCILWKMETFFSDQSNQSIKTKVIIKKHFHFIANSNAATFYSKT